MSNVGRMDVRSDGEKARTRLSTGAPISAAHTKRSVEPEVTEELVQVA